MDQGVCLSTITVIGTGYVGLTTAVLLAESGHNVYALDINPDRLAAIRQGRSFFFEAGMDNLVSHSIKSGNLLPTDSYKDSVSHSDFVFSCVGTPDNADGSSNLTYVFQAAQEAALYMPAEAIYIQKSTVPVGTGAKVEEAFLKAGKKISYVSNPEFLREGTAIADSLWFDRVVAGGTDESAVNKVLDLYKQIEKHRHKIAKTAGLADDTGATDKLGKYFTTNRDSAELIKVTSNAFLALKISFANSIAKFADRTGADVNQVMDVVGADKRIGRAFLNAGRGYGGGCFPKDVSSLISSAGQHGIDFQIMIAAAELNESMPAYITDKAQAALGSLQSKKTAVLGLAFKAGTSDARRSPGVMLANLLRKQDAYVSVYDPESNDGKEIELLADITVSPSIEDALKDADTVFIATDWPVFMNYDLKNMRKLMKGELFVDAVNAFSKSKVEAAGFKYMGVGR